MYWITNKEGNPTKLIDRNEKLPPANQIVHRQAVNKAGLVRENAVAYSVTLGAEWAIIEFHITQGF
ncbi:hypothetical protein QP615_20975 [Providencia rettgeri]|nr:hypothetical protein [Providencia rettgeri]MDK7747188.1 hypothetical protein [Providencia rettgeri]MDK7760024.1 hypothetical protein [Providencia rettgeri]